MMAFFDEHWINHHMASPGLHRTKEGELRRRAAVEKRRERLARREAEAKVEARWRGRGPRSEQLSRRRRGSVASGSGVSRRSGEEDSEARSS